MIVWFYPSCWSFQLPGLCSSFTTTLNWQSSTKLFNVLHWNVNLIISKDTIELFMLFIRFTLLLLVCFFFLLWFVLFLHVLSLMLYHSWSKLSFLNIFFIGSSKSWLSKYLKVDLVLFITIPSYSRFIVKNNFNIRLWYVNKNFISFNWSFWKVKG